MATISWKDQYNIHYKDIDAQHQGLVALINQLGDLTGASTRLERFADIYRQLCQYAILHFRTEEHYLEASGYEDLAEVSRLCGHPFTEAEFVPIFTGIFTPIRSTFQLIRLLKQHYRLGLISNTNPWHFEHVIQPSELFPLFDAVTLSYRAHALKPDPALFQDCLDQLGLMAEECVFIDDVAGFAEAATGHLLHGIHYTGHQDLLRQLRGLKVSFWKS